MKIFDICNIPKNFFDTIEFSTLENVDKIINDVKNNGDNAIKKYTKMFDNINLNDLSVSKQEIENAFEVVNDDIKEAISYSINNVKQFAQGQLNSLSDFKMQINNSVLGHKIIPIESVGCYVPGGNYPLLSSAIMTVVPAKVAGVKRIVVCSPNIKPEVIVSAKLSGADEIYKIGGAQAISAMAYGTETISSVNKIVGPGNKYVTASKKSVFGKCGIDFLAGPSEIMIIADESCNVDFVACDILAQCEHDKDARAYLICNSKLLAEQIIQKTYEFLETLSTKNVAKISFENSIAIVSDDFEKTVSLTNERAPEHLELCFKDCENYLDSFKNYGSLFIGNYSAEVFGDYTSGTNHTLPTNQVAKYSGGLSVFDYVKIQTYQKINKDDLSDTLKATSILANAEGLIAHKLACDIRNNQ